MTEYLGNDRNIVRDADLTASNIVASDAIFRTDTDPKEGGGTVKLTGPYSGQSDTIVDVEILDATATSSRVSQPVFTGIGNGAMSGLTAADVAAQSFTIIVENLGTQTRKAYAPFQGTTLVARAAGTPGNAITVRVSHNGLVRASTDFALQEELREGTNEYVGDHWNFGAATLLPDGSIPADAPRVVLGADPQVYRAFRRYKEGRYVYGFSPSPVRNAERGTRVYTVTGTHTITITDGTDTDTLIGIVSLYDALAKIRDESTLVTVDGPVVNSMQPGGQGALELSVWTASYVLGVTADGSDAVRRAVLDVTATPVAPTETLTIECISAEATGSELWRVHGDVSERRANAVTNVAYADGPYAFTIPPPEVPSGDPGTTTGNIRPDFLPLARDTNSTLPRIKFVRPVLGAAARNARYGFVWTQRPPEDCAEDGVVIGGPRRDCLGIIPPGDENVSDASHKRRLQRLTAAVRLHVGTNTGPSSTASATDIAAIERGANILRDCLRKLLGGTLDNPAWEASTPYGLDEAVEPPVPNGYRYAVTTPGTSGATEPALWSTTTGATVTDGGITWTNIGKKPFGMWDDLFTQWSNEAAMLAGPGPSISAATWTSDAFALVGDYLVPPTPNGCVYRAASSVGDSGPTPSATHGTIEPPWPQELTGTPADRITLATTSSPPLSTTWVLAYRYWSPRQFVAKDTIARPGNGRVYAVTTPGITGSTEPAWTSTDGSTTNDGAAVWTEIAATDLAIAPNDAYFERFSTGGKDVLAAAGIESDFDFASTDGDGCWQDPGDDGYWQSKDGLLPIFNNLYYHSSRQLYDQETGEPYNVSTREFGIGVGVGCIENLVFGDELEIVIDGVQGSTTGRGYQEGDVFAVRVNYASPVPFGGGQTGDDTITLSVAGSLLGRLPDYALLTTAPAPYAGTVPAWVALTPYTAGNQRRPTVRNGKRYTATTGTSGASEPVWPTTIGATVADGTVTWTCASADANIGFQIAPGGIPFTLGDRFAFEVEGGHFRWRRDGGSWSSTLAIGPTALSDGLAIAFAGGIAPSWVAGDVWSFKAEATNGADQLRQPTDARCVWTDSTVIDVTPTGSGEILGVLLGDHTIAPSATIRLQGSDDDFSTTPVNVVVPWRRGSIWHAHAGTRARWRITVDQPGSLQWLWLGEPYAPTIQGDEFPELGLLTKRFRLPGVSARAGIGVDVEHTALSATAVDRLIAMLEHACAFDDRRIGIVTNGAEGAIVEYRDASLTVSEVLGFQPTDPEKRLHNVTMTLSPTP